MAAIRARGTRAKEKDSAARHGLIGNARVSTEEQGTDPQLDELSDAGCVAIHQEHASDADQSRPVLARLLRKRTPRGGTRWHASSVRHLLRRADRLGLLGAPSPALPSDGHA